MIHVNSIVTGMRRRLRLIHEAQAPAHDIFEGLFGKVSLNGWRFDDAGQVVAFSISICRLRKSYVTYRKKDLNLC